MGILDGLCKDKIFYFFEQICNIPHGSTHEMALSDYIVAFARERGLYCRQDEAYNVLVKKPASKGYENAPGVIFQGHIDMVCEKLAGTEMDFLTEHIQLCVEDDIIHAKGTTLGADNGIAVAYMLTVLDDSTLEHPAIEAIFTVEEELGMGGARAFDASDITGKCFINMDTEEEGVLLSGCCGGRRVRLYQPIAYVDPKPDTVPYRIGISGLKGGHSGADIHLQRASANRLIGRILYEMKGKVDFSVAAANGGNMDNAICREAELIILLKKTDAEKAKEIIEGIKKIFIEEYNTREPFITIVTEPLKEKVFKVFDAKTTQSLISLLLLLPYGVQTMSIDMPALVESSSNIGILKTTGEYIYIDNAVRSSVESRKEFICNKIKVLAELNGARVEEVNDYPGWRYDPNSKLIALFAETYRRLFDKEPVIAAIHAGLECGLFAQKLPGIDMISIGPEMHDVHTPDERLSVSSSIRVWLLIKEVLKAMKA